MKKIMLSLCLILLVLVIPISVFATPDNSKMLNSQNNQSYTEDPNDNETKEYMEIRDALIDKLGIDKAYKLLGFEKVEENVTLLKTKDTKNLSSIVSPYVISDPGGGGSSSYCCFNNFGKYFAYMKMSTYRNYSLGKIDITYEVQYVNGFKSGYSTFSYDDIFTCNHSTTVVRQGVTKTSSMNTLKYGPYGIGGYITDGSTYARLIITGKPVAPYTISNLTGNASMELLHKINGLPSDVAWSLSFYIGVSYTPNTYVEDNFEIYF